ncbi:putative low-affinity inorganic phosphate transporter [Francisella sp. W12-1067]|nr:putative low-affinity inorganic phosphate transporter [Francisella sp. W12-1067]
MVTSMLIIIICVALFFEFTNGFHDAANVVATPIATKSLTPYQAIGLAAFFNFLGAFFGTAVAATISKGLVDTSIVSDIVLVSALLGAISWNFFTWYFGIPSSSSHALIGSLVGAVIIGASYKDVNYITVVNKVLVPMISSPILAFFVALIVCIVLLNIFTQVKNVRLTNKYIRELQVVSTSLLSFSHGSNDAQKTMSIITLALLSAGLVQSTVVPDWVIIVCGVAMGLGTLSGGKKIIKTLSTKLSKLEPTNAVSAELSSGLLVLGASHIGLPVSTTQVASGSIMGAGFADSGVNWRVVKKLATAWLLTIPACIFVTGTIYTILYHSFGSF